MGKQRQGGLASSSANLFDGTGRPRGGSFIDGLFGSGELASAIKEFVHPGKGPSEVLMRVVFKDQREANAAVLFLRKCDEFHMEGHKTLLLNRLCSSVSVEGKGRSQLLQAVVGQLLTHLYRGGQKSKKGNGDDADE